MKHKKNIIRSIHLRLNNGKYDEKYTVHYLSGRRQGFNTRGIMNEDHAMFIRCAKRIPRYDRDGNHIGDAYMLPAPFEYLERQIRQIESGEK